VPGKKPPPKFATIDAPSILEELDAARGELQRLSGNLMVARRQLEAGRSTAQSAEQRLRDELDAIRIDLKVALADLEIAKTEAARLTRLCEEACLREEEARKAAARAERAADRNRDELLDLKREVEHLRLQIQRPSD
jgi:chromosome segregation ATPase